MPTTVRLGDSLVEHFALGFCDLEFERGGLAGTVGALCVLGRRPG